jgi:hypothetical protein
MPFQFQRNTARSLGMIAISLNAAQSTDSCIVKAVVSCAALVEGSK